MCCSDAQTSLSSQLIGDRTSRAAVQDVHRASCRAAAQAPKTCILIRDYKMTPSSLGSASKLVHPRRGRLQPDAAYHSLMPMGKV